MHSDALMHHYASPVKYHISYNDSKQGLQVSNPGNVTFQYHNVSKCVTVLIIWHHAEEIILCV